MWAFFHFLYSIYRIELAHFRLHFDSHLSITTAQHIWNLNCFGFKLNERKTERRLYAMRLNESRTQPTRHAFKTECQTNKNGKIMGNSDDICHIWCTVVVTCSVAVSVMSSPRVNWKTLCKFFFVRLLVAFVVCSLWIGILAPISVSGLCKFTVSKLDRCVSLSMVSHHTDDAHTTIHIHFSDCQIEINSL